MNGIPPLVSIALVVWSLTNATSAGRASNAPPFPRKTRDAKRISEVVDGAARTFLESRQAVGLSIGVFKDGKTYTYNFGTTERGKQHPPTAHTLYAIASLTKTFTGLLLAKAVEEKKVGIDDDVRKYLDGSYPNLEYQGQPVRLWQLINHTSGLPMNFPENTGFGAGDRAIVEKYTREDLLHDLHGVKLTRVPGEKFSYSNVAAQLLGLILEGVYGKSYEELVRIKITGPLKMHDTKVTLTAAEMTQMPKAYNGGDAFFPALSTQLPAAASLKSSLSDLLKYLSWHIAETDPAVIRTHQPAGSTVWREDNSYTVGLNWQILRSPDRHSIFTNGNVPGFHSEFIMFPELHLGIIVLTNEEEVANRTGLSALADQIAKAIDPRVAGVLQE
jgi:D-alanyl-D-alanine-carboxypeptidase/D-alanyl-D-alanine-endopeptidase